MIIAKWMDKFFYNIVNGENYEVTIEHNGKTVTYKQTDDDSKIGRLLNLKEHTSITN